MSVYVDDYRARYGRLVLSHMMADTDAELEGMARALGLDPSWKHGDHYDVCQSKKRRAIELGAVAVTAREIVRVRMRRRANEPGFAH